MNYQTRAFIISFLLHSVIVFGIIILSIATGQSKKVVALDFNLCKPEPPVKEDELPTPPIPVMDRKTIKPKVYQPSKGKKSPISRQAPHKSSSPNTAPEVELPKTDSPENRAVGLGIPDNPIAEGQGSPGVIGGTAEGAGTGPGGGGTGGGIESAKRKYLEDQFAYIRDKILKNIVYPDVARRMGWQGKVLLSFIITAEGHVREFNIIESSGFPVLDKIAIGTVKDTAPFPKPPGEVQLVMPIIYRLE